MKAHSYLLLEMELAKPLLPKRPASPTPNRQGGSTALIFCQSIQKVTDLTVFYHQKQGYSHEYRNGLANLITVNNHCQEFVAHERQKSLHTQKFSLLQMQQVATIHNGVLAMSHAYHNEMIVNLNLYLQVSQLRNLVMHGHEFNYSGKLSVRPNLWLYP